MMLMLMVGLFSFSACSSDDDDDDKSAVLDKDGNVSLIGTWTLNSDEETDWPYNDVVEALNFKNNNTGTVTGTVVYKDTQSGREVPTALNGTFDYQLTWNNGIGTLRIANIVGRVGFLTEGTYTLSINGSTNRLTTTLLRLNGVNYRRK